MTFTSYNLFMRDLSSKGIDYAVKHAASLGFSGVEFLDFCMTGDPIDKEKFPATEMKRALEENGIKVDCYSVYACVLSGDEQDRFFKEIYDIIDYAAAVGAKLFHHTLMPYLKLDPDAAKYEDVFPRVLEVERKVVKYCAERGLKCIFEPQGFYFNGVEGLSRIINALREDFPDVGFCADLGNTVYVDCDPVDVTAALGSLTKHVHIKDYIISDESLGRRGEGRSPAGKYLNEVLPGEGELRLGECLQIIKSTGYDGPIALEYVCDDETAKKSMEYIKKLWEE